MSVPIDTRDDWARWLESLPYPLGCAVGIGIVVGIPFVAFIAMTLLTR